MGLRQQLQDNSSEIKQLLGVPSDEPIFILRAQDKFSIDTITQYKAIAHNQTPIGEESIDWVSDIMKIKNDFINWQRDNKDKVKVPD